MAEETPRQPSSSCQIFILRGRRDRLAAIPSTLAVVAPSSYTRYYIRSLFGSYEALSAHFYCSRRRVDEHFYLQIRRRGQCFFSRKGLTRQRHFHTFHTNRKATR